MFDNLAGRAVSPDRLPSGMIRIKNVNCSNPQLFPVLARIVMYAPFGDQAVRNPGGPNGGIMLVIVRPIRVTAQDHETVPRFNRVKNIFVFRVYFKKLFPGFDHFFFSSGHVAVPVYKNMVVGREFGQ